MKRAVAWLLASTPTLAHAHALPVGLEIAWPATGEPVVLTNRGMVFDAQLRCNEAYGVNTSAYPRLWVGAEHTLITTQNAVLHTRDRGCTLTHAQGLPERSLSGFAAAEGAVLVSTLTAEAGGGVYASSDQGLRFARIADNEPYEAFRDLMFAPGDAQRVYASGFRVEPVGSKVQYVWAVSRDGGRTFARQSVGAERNVLAVSPRNADVVWAWEGLGDDTVVYKSVDSGSTFAERLRLAGKPSLAVSATSSSVWAGAEGSDGIRVSRDDGETFVSFAPELTSVSCLTLHADALHVCGVRYPIELGIWSTPESADGPLRDELMFAEVAEPVTCPGEKDTCILPWRDWELELLSSPPTASVADASVLDAGSVDASVPAVMPQVDASLAPAAGSSGCSTTGAAEGGWWLLVLAWTRRRISAVRRR